MKCEKCGKAYPLEYYFKTGKMCITCFEPE